MNIPINHLKNLIDKPGGWQYNKKNPEIVVAIGPVQGYIVTNIEMIVIREC